VAGVLREWAQLRARLRALSLDVAIDVQGLLKSAHFSVLTRAPVRIGFARSHAREPLASCFVTHRVAPPPQAVHVVDQNLSLLGPLGVERGEVVFPLPRAADAGQRAQAFLDRRGIGSGARIVALLPGAHGQHKQWPAASFRALAERFLRERGVRVLVLGGPGEEALLDAVACGLGPSAATSADGTILDLMSLLRRAHLAVGNDTGPLHLAAALGVPAVGLYGPTRAERNGPYGPRARSLQSPTRRMTDLATDQVAAAAMECLA
jgi:ADP-heptose:LPS heptosyltransferase